MFSHRRANSTLVSLAIHGGAVVMLFLLSGYGPRPRVQLTPHQRVVRLLEPWAAPRHAGAGGGGNHSATPASKGQPPPHRLFQAPLVVTRSVRTPLLMEPAPSLSIEIPTDMHLPQFGDPHGQPGPPSSGPGGGGGIGDGVGSSIGDRTGPGYGDGDPGSGIGGRGRITAPVLVWKVDPDYSDPARAAKIQGLVVLRVEIDKSGNIHDVRVDHGLGLGLDEKAVDAVRHWRFLPGTRNGRAVATTAVVEVRFRLL